MTDRDSQAVQAAALSEFIAAVDRLITAEHPKGESPYGVDEPFNELIRARKALAARPVSSLVSGTTPDEGLREALVFARGELHRALLERGSTVGYRASFERINAALAPVSLSSDEGEAI